MGLIDRNGTRVGLDDGKPDVIIPSMDDIQELHRIADAAELQAKLAKEQAQEAKESAKKANRNAFISRLIALGAFLISLATFILKFFVPGF